MVEYKINVSDRFKGVDPVDIKSIINEETLPFDVMILNLRDGRNAGNIVRVCNLTGVDKVVVLGRKKFEKTGSVGAHHYTKIERIAAIPNSDYIDFEKLEEADNVIDTEIFSNYITSNNYLPVFVEQTEDALVATTQNIQTVIQCASSTGKKPIFIFGNESFGIPKNILQTRFLFPCSYVLQLQQRGCIRSHNVANCCSIICYKVMEILTEF